MAACGLRHPGCLVSKKCAYRWVSKGRFGWRSVFPEFLLEKAQEGGEQQRHRSQEMRPNTQHPTAASAVTQQMRNTFLRKGVLISKCFPKLIIEVLSTFFWQIRQPATRGRLMCTCSILHPSNSWFPDEEPCPVCLLGAWEG